MFLHLNLRIKPHKQVDRHKIVFLHQQGDFPKSYYLKTWHVYIFRYTAAFSMFM